MNKILVGLLFSLAVMYGQQPNRDTLSMTAEPPTGVQGISVNQIGVNGGSNYCYWVVAVFAGGMDGQPRAGCTNSSNATLTGSNYNVITWNPAGSATGYWVIRATGNGFPGSGTVAVNSTVLASTVTTLNDQSNTLNNFSWVPMGVANASLRLANTQNFSFPNIIESAAKNITFFAFLPPASTKPGILYVIYDSPSPTTCSGGGGVGTPSLCLSNGTTWIPMATSVSGGTTTIQTNGVNNTSQNPVNFTNSAAFNGLTFTFTNPAGGIVQLGATGTLNNSGLTNGSNYVLNNQVNTYGAFKQTFTPSSSTAPINIGLVTGSDPSLPVNGDLWWRSDLFTLNTFWGGVIGRVPYISGGAITTPPVGCAQWTPGAFGLTGTGVACGSGSGGGTVTSFSVSGVTAPYFGVAVTNPTTTPNLAFTPSNFSADNILGNFTAGSAVPSTQAVPACANDGIHALVYVSHILTCATLTTGGAGTVTSVSWTGGIVSIATATTTPAFTIAGTSGGIPYFNSATSWASSGVLGANLPLFGGGAGAAPIAGTRSGNTTEVVTTTGLQTSGHCVNIDGNGNHVDSGAACGSSSGGSVFTGSVATNSTGITGTATNPILSGADQSVKSPLRFELAALAANVASVTFNTFPIGATFDVVWLQNGTGGFTVTYGGTTTNTCTIDPTANIATTQSFQVSVGSVVTGIGCTTNNTGVTGGPTAAAPGTPASGQFFTWVDTTNGVFSSKANASTTVSNTVVPLTCTSGQFVSSLSAAGVLACATPAGGGNVSNNIVNTFTSAGTLNLAAASPTAGLNVPVASGASPVTNGTVAFDSASSNVVYGCGAGTCTVARKIIGGTAALGTSLITANSCATVVTVSAAGTASTDTISWVPNADISSVTGYGVASTDGLKIYPYPTTNNVNFRVCNGTSASITPGAVTLNWGVVR